jgi:prepilin-type processing-associated H-X9-DG protein
LGDHIDEASVGNTGDATTSYDMCDSDRYVWSVNWIANSVKSISMVTDGASNTLTSSEHAHCYWFSFHPGGANFLFGDGSVQFIKESISLENLASGRAGQTRMAKLTYEDLSGSVPDLLWPEEFVGMVDHVKNDQIVFVRGALDRRRDPPELIVSRITPLKQGCCVAFFVPNVPICAMQASPLSRPYMLATPFDRPPIRPQHRRVVGADAGSARRRRSMAIWTSPPMTRSTASSSGRATAPSPAWPPGLSRGAARSSTPICIDRVGARRGERPCRRQGTVEFGGMAVVKSE